MVTGQFLDLILGYIPEIPVSYGLGIQVWAKGICWLIAGGVLGFVGQVGVPHNPNKNSSRNPVTDWEKAYKELKIKHEAIEREYAFFKDQTEDFHFFVDPQNRSILIWNQEAPDWLPVNLADWVYRPDSWLKHIRPEKKEEVSRFLFSSPGAATPGNTEKLIYTLLHPDGSTLDINHCRRFVAHPENGRMMYAHRLCRLPHSTTQNELLASGENLFRMIVSLVPGYNVFLFDAQKRFILADGGELIKYNYNKTFMEGKYIEEILDPETLKSVLPYYDRTLAGEMVFDILDTPIDKFEVRSIPIYNAKQEVIGGLIASGNITELHNNRLRVQELSTWFSLVASVAEVGIWEADFSLGTLRANATFHQFYGLPVNDDWQNIGLFFQKLHPDDHSMISEIRGSLENNNGAFDISYRTLDDVKGIRHLHTHGRVIGDEKGNPVRAVGFDWDVTQSVNLSNNFRRLSLFAEQTNNLLILYAETGEIIETNKAYFDLLGDSALDQHYIQKIFLQESTSISDDHWWRKPVNADLPVSTEVRLHLPGSSVRWFHLTLMRIKEGDFQEKATYLALAEDISERKNAEKEVINLVSELWLNNQMVADLTFHFSHRLLRQSSNLNGLVNLMESSSPEEPVYQTSLRYLINAASELQQDLQEVSRRMEDSRGLPSTPESFNFEELLEDVFFHVGSGIIQPFDQLNIHTPNGKILLEPRAYWRSLLQILVNNSLERRKDVSPLLVSAILVQDEHSAVLHYQDNGYPLENEHLTEGLDGFMRSLDPSAPQKGLGLPFLKVVVKLLNGELEVEKPSLQGNSFRFRLKKAEPSFSE